VAVRSNELIFFFGAGASKPFGIPTMRELTEIIKTNLDGNNLHEYNSIYNKFQKNGKNEIDIEGILSIIQFLSEGENENINDVINYLLFTRNHSQDISSQHNKSELDNLKLNIVKLIRQYCTRASNLEYVFKVYQNFFETITEVLSGGTYDTKLPIRYDDNWTIFTTNYDIIIESLWKEYLDNKIYFGFEGGRFQPDYFLYTSSSEIFKKKELIHNMIRLVKLHGSVSWLIKKTTGEVIEKEFNLNEANGLGKGSLYVNEIMMYPLLEKNLYQSPYIQMFYYLDQEWNSKRVCIVIGYSFRDSIIKNVFSSQLRKNKDKKIILVDPNAKEIIHNTLNEFTDQIVPIEREFGSLDYEGVNNEIKEKLSTI
jgi:hypothetical protein